MSAEGWIATGSILVSIVAIVVSGRASKKATAVDERLVEIEEARRAEELEQRDRAADRAVHADVIAVRLEKRQLAIVNNGPGTASTVTIEVWGEDEGRGVEPLLVVEDPAQRSWRDLPPGKSVTIEMKPRVKVVDVPGVVAVSSRLPEPLEYLLEWTDGCSQSPHGRGPTRLYERAPDAAT